MALWADDEGAAEVALDPAQAAVKDEEASVEPEAGPEAAAEAAGPKKRSRRGEHPDPRTHDAHHVPNPNKV